MRQQVTDIASQDEPAKRMMRPALQPKLLASLDIRRHSNKLRNVTNSAGPSRFKQCSNQQYDLHSSPLHLQNVSKLMATQGDGRSKKQFNVHLTHTVYQKGLIFRGIYRNGRKASGHFKFDNGFEYSGACNGNSFEGQGSLIYPSGKVYCGLWNHSKLQTPAKIYYPTGEVYFGGVKDYKKHGYGQLYFNGRQKYVGQFLNGSITGRGTYFFDQQPLSKGIWMDGCLVESEDLDSLEKCSSQEQNQVCKSSTKQLKIDGRIDECDQKISQECTKPSKDNAEQ